MNLQQSLLCFSDSEAAAARAAAIDNLHLATAIYTAPPVVDALLARMNWPNGGRRLVDPSAGDGAFLGRALNKLIAAGDPGDESILDVMGGWEIHPAACVQARRRISGILVAAGRSQAVAEQLAERMVRNDDFLIDGPTTPSVDVIVGNPPYLRWLHVPKLLRDDYARHVPAYASSDMLHSFLDRCSAVLRTNGEIGLITSDRWLFSVKAAKLREQLGRRLSIKHLAREDSKSCFYRPKSRRAGTPPRVHPVAVHLSHSGGDALTREAIYPGASLVQRPDLPTLGELAVVRMAPWLGTPGIFLLTGAEAAASGLPSSVLVPAVDTADVVEGRLGDATRYAIRTEPGASPCAAVTDHLARNMQKMAKRGREGKAWMPPESFHALDLAQPVLMVPRIARTSTPIRVPSGHLVVNHNLTISCPDQVLLDRIEKAMAGAETEAWLRVHAAPLEGGYFAVTAPLLRKMPLDLGDSTKRS